MTIMKPIFASQDVAAVTIVRGLLADQGIETAMQNENMSAVLGDIPFMHAMPELCLLREEDEPAARAIVEQFEAGRVSAPEAAADWTCPNCGEVVQGQFTDCWKCCTPRPQA